MAEPLKHFFDAERVRIIGAMLHGAEPTFPIETFCPDASAGLGTKELMGRAQHIADAMARALPSDGLRALDIVVRTVCAPQPAAAGGMSAFIYLPHTMFVATHGLLHPDAALDAQHAITPRFSCEFSIRAFLERWPELTLARLARWVSDPDPHVRRLVSEGTRPRLPWASRLRALQADPSPILPLLERLRDDPSEYVRRSVANNLNDIGKDHPAVLLGVCRQWLVDAPAPRVALVRHALRDRVKKGDIDAIALLGAGGGTFAVRGELPAAGILGGSLAVVVHVSNLGATTSRAIVDLAVVFPGSSAAGRRKVFKVRTVELAPGETVVLRKSISLRDQTTRRAIAGPHVLAAQVDGRVTLLGTVNVTGP
ncbi:MAG: DNA alkylation repair protein [Pseudomonadota bacterium]|nr:DNA alkylation repair protein [Pseudomonadota bacterium]